MGRFYGTQIVDGKKTIEDVPSYWRAATEKWLSENQ